jgi:calcineurin-like phosphoesterase family protein
MIQVRNVENDMSEVNNLLQKNWSIVVWLVAAVFAAGSIYAEFTAIKSQLSSIEDRLDQKIIVIDGLEKRIINLEKEVEYEKGYLQGKKEGN